MNICASIYIFIGSVGIYTAKEVRTERERRGELGFSKIQGEREIKKKIKIKSEREPIRIPKARILRRFYKNQCRNSFSKTGLSNSCLKI